MTDLDEDMLPSDDDLPPADDSAGRGTLLDAMIEIRDALDGIKEAMAELEALRQQPSLKPRLETSRSALAACELRMSFPVFDPPPGFSKLVKAAADGRLNHHARRALIITETEATAMISANAALGALDALGEPFQPSWSNLPTSLLARAVTRFAFVLLKRIPGLQV
jgi:hypothetical protein